MSREVGEGAVRRHRQLIHCQQRQRPRQRLRMEKLRPVAQPLRQHFPQPPPAGHIRHGDPPPFRTQRLTDLLPPIQNPLMAHAEIRSRAQQHRPRLRRYAQIHRREKLRPIHRHAHPLACFQIKPHPVFRRTLRHIQRIRQQLPRNSLLRPQPLRDLRFRKGLRRDPVLPYQRSLPAPGQLPGELPPSGFFRKNHLRQPAHRPPELRLLLPQYQPAKQTRILQRTNRWHGETRLIPTLRQAEQHAFPRAHRWLHLPFRIEVFAPECSISMNPPPAVASRNPFRGWDLKSQSIVGTSCPWILPHLKFEI